MSYVIFVICLNLTGGGNQGDPYLVQCCVSDSIHYYWSCEAGMILLPPVLTEVCNDICRLGNTAVNCKANTLLNHIQQHMFATLLDTQQTVAQGDAGIEVLLECIYTCMLNCRLYNQFQIVSCCQLLECCHHCWRMLMM
jgi:hypothetical protein